MNKAPLNLPKALHPQHETYLAPNRGAYPNKRTQTKKQKPPRSRGYLTLMANLIIGLPSKNCYIGGER